MSKSRAVSVPVRKHTKTDSVYRELRRRIREAKLQPGALLKKEAIASEFGVSRAPVSEAIALLAEEGLVDVYPQRGSFVAPIRSEDIQEALLIRMGLEVEAVRRVTHLADTDVLHQLNKNIEAQGKAVRNNNMELLDSLDGAFHGIIISSIKAPRAQRLLDSARLLLDRPRFHALPEEGRPRATLAEHRRIADAISTGNVELAGAAMRVHIIMVTRAIQREMAQSQHQFYSAHR